MSNNRKKGGYPHNIEMDDFIDRIMDVEGLDISVKQARACYNTFTALLRLTVDDLRLMPDGIFATGLISEDRRVSMDISENAKYKWVAKRGGGPADWAIYIGPISWPLERICSNGDKLKRRDEIENLVPCTQEAIDQYRL